MGPSTTFLLVHGSWHGPWCWEPLLGELQRLGHHGATVALPSVGADPASRGEFADDAVAVTVAAAELSGPVIVVGHSYGGAVITKASYGDGVSQLVYLGAFMPDTGRPFASYLPPGPLPPYVGMSDDGTMSVPAGQAVPAFYGECADVVATWAESMLRPQSASVIEPAITAAAWRRLPSTYVVLTHDGAIPVELQRTFAAQADEVVELESDHSPMLSHPAELAQVLDRVARSEPTRP